LYGGIRTSSFFSRVAEEWEEVAAGLPDPGSYMESLTGMLGEGGTVLELGCGTGAMIRVLAGRFRDVIAVDSSPEMLDVATREVGDSGADFRLGALEHLPVADSSVEAALAHMVLHHLADPAEVFPEVDRVLVPGGRLLVADLAHHADEPFRMAQGDLWPGFEPAEIEAWALRSGLSAAGCTQDASKRVLLMLFTKENKR
jgi:ArsR family transcriptional regulator